MASNEGHCYWCRFQTE